MVNDSDIDPIIILVRNVCDGRSKLKLIVTAAVRIWYSLVQLQMGFKKVQRKKNIKTNEIFF